MKPRIPLGAFGACLVLCLAPAFRAADAPATRPAPPAPKAGDYVTLNPFEVKAEADNSYGALNSNSLTQFNDQAHAWTANVRFSWLNTAGTGLFIVFNDAEQADGFFNWKRPQTHALTIKFTRQFGSGG